MKKNQPINTCSFKDELPENEYYFTKKNHLSEDFPLHTHDYFEIEIITSGEAANVFNGTELKLSRGSAHILSPTDVHDLKIKEPIDIYKLMIIPNWVNEKILHKLMNNIGTVKFSEEELKDIIPLLDLIIKEGQSNSSFQKDMLHNLISCLLIFFSRKYKINPQIQPTTAITNIHIKKAVNYILLNYTSPISSEDVAKVINLNPVYFCSLFHKTMGITFINYINNLRLHRAKQLLTIESYSVSEACFGCGFNSSSNFLRAFKKKYGYAPNEIKMEYKR